MSESESNLPVLDGEAVEAFFRDIPASAHRDLNSAADNSNIIRPSKLADSYATMKLRSAGNISNQFLL